MAQNEKNIQIKFEILYNLSDVIYQTFNIQLKGVMQETW